MQDDGGPPGFTGICNPSPTSGAFTSLRVFSSFVVAVIVFAGGFAHTQSLWFGTPPSFARSKGEKQLGTWWSTSGR